MRLRLAHRALNADRARHRSLRISSAGMWRELLLERGIRCAPWFAPAAAFPSSMSRRVTGDLRDPDSLERAVAGCGLVFHVAADYRLWSKDPERTLPLECGWHAQHARMPRERPEWSASSTPAPSAASASRMTASAMKTQPCLDRRYDGRLQALEVSWPSRWRSNFARGGFRCDRQPHRAHRRSRFQAYAHRQDRRSIS